MVQHEPSDFFDPDTVGLFAAIGIQEGQAVRAGREDEGDPDRRRRGRQCTARAVTLCPARSARRDFS